MREIKFKYGYSNGTNLFEKVFTLSDIEQGLQFDEICDSPLMKDYEIVHKRQYTGLKDKNGVEIYVSDILEFKAPLFEKKPSPNPKCIGTTNELAKIDLTSGGFVFVRKFWWNDRFYPDMGDALADMQTKSWIQYHCTVIGNIYENPELLDG